MHLIEKKIKNYNLIIPKQALPTINEIWNDRIYNKNYKIKKGDLIFDIGANAGIFSIFAASSGAEVYSFEPNPEMFNLLNKNIKANNLVDKIHTFNSALGNVNGDVILSIPDSDKIYSEACASLNDTLIGDLEKTVKNDFQRIKIKCLKLSSIIRKLNINKINFIKMDCEGAEYSIIESLDENSAAKIQNISMETHGPCYTQKKLCALLNSRNFKIDKLTKISLIKNTGFIYCSNNKISNKKIIGEPIADFKINYKKKYIFIGNEITLDGTDSFILNSKNLNFKYKWYLNNNRIKNISESIFNITPDKSGLNTVKLEVSTNNKIDTMEKHFFTLESGCFKNIINHRFKKQNCPVHSKISGIKKTFLIPSEILPNYKKTGNIILGIEKSNSNIPAVFNFNGKELYIKNYYEQITLDDLYFEEDIIFTLKTDQDKKNITKVKIKWWEAPEKRLINESINIQKGNDDTILPAQGLEMMFQFTDEKLFTISHEYYPKEWVPNKIVIGVDTAEDNNIKTPLKGFMNIKNQIYIIDGYYKEIKLNDFDLENNFDFKINLLNKNCIKLIWWNE